MENTQLSNLVIFTDELAEQLLEEEGLSHPDIERLVRYVWLVQSYPYNQPKDSQIKYYREKLSGWVHAEEESYHGEHEDYEEFARYYLDNFMTIGIPSWVVIDYGRTWEANLRHDFTAEDNGHGIWVWSNIY